jgi:peptide-methionine (S)-S-oxide reductase
MRPTHPRRGALIAAALALTATLAFGWALTRSTASAAPAAQKKTPKTPRKPERKGKVETATLANGCFWCTEAIFKEIRGVDTVEPGYTGGKVENPTYEQVCSGTTGHAEAIQITFDPKVVSYHDLLAIYFATHDPTTLNRQGADVGTQYRSAIFTHSPEQKETAERVVKELTAKKLWRNPIVTEVTPFTKWWPAEDYHRDYYARNGRQPYCVAVIEPKLKKFREQYREKLKK